MRYQIHILLILLLLAMTGCDVIVASENPIATADFITATLPATSIPISTLTALPPTPAATIAPVTGTTTTQVNVRAETSTASENLGVIAQFSTVQIIEKDASGSWYRIIYPASPSGVGWVRAEYVQVNTQAEIKVAEAGSGNGSAVSGLVVQKINVRNGPATSFETLGVLNPNDVVFMTGKDPSGAWIQIEYAGAPDGKGWAASEFLQIDPAAALPVIGNLEPTAQNSSVITMTPASIISYAMQDGDSMTAPLAEVTIAPTSSRAFQVTGDVSTPEGDHEDWIKFISFSGTVAINVLCSSNALQVELWNNGIKIDNLIVACGEGQILKINPNNIYALRLFNLSSNDLIYTKYTLSVEAVR